MGEPQPDLANAQNRSLNGCAQGNENLAALVDGSDEGAGDLCACLGGIGADWLLKPNFERRSCRNGLGRKTCGRNQNAETAGHNLATEPPRQWRLHQASKCPSA